MPSTRPRKRTRAGHVIRQRLPLSLGKAHKGGINRSKATGPLVNTPRPQDRADNAHQPARRRPSRIASKPANREMVTHSARDEENGHPQRQHPTEHHHPANGYETRRDGEQERAPEGRALAEHAP